MIYVNKLHLYSFCCLFFELKPSSWYILLNGTKIIPRVLFYIWNDIYIYIYNILYNIYNSKHQSTTHFHWILNVSIRPTVFSYISLYIFIDAAEAADFLYWKPRPSRKLVILPTPSVELRFPSSLLMMWVISWAEEMRRKWQRQQQCPAVKLQRHAEIRSGLRPFPGLNKPSARGTQSLVSNYCYI